MKIHWSNKRGLNNNIHLVVHLRESRTFYAVPHAIVWSIFLYASKYKVDVQQRIKACYCERSVNSSSSVGTTPLSLLYNLNWTIKKMQLHTLRHLRLIGKRGVSKPLSIFRDVLKTKLIFAASVKDILFQFYSL